MCHATRSRQAETIKGTLEAAGAGDNDRRRNNKVVAADNSAICFGLLDKPHDQRIEGQKPNTR